MKYLYKTLSGMTSGQKTYYAEIRTDGEKLYFTIYNSTHSADYSSASVSYNSVSQTVWFSESGEKTVSFDYNDNIKEIDVFLSGINHHFSWNGSFADPDPTVNVTHTGIRVNSTFLCNFSFTGEAQNCRLLEAEIYRFTNGYELQYHSTSLSDESSFSYHFFEDAPTRVLYRTELTFACYTNASDSRDSYIGLKKYVLPDMVLTENRTPYTPWSLRYYPEAAGLPVEVSWADINDPSFPNAEYVLMRNTNKMYYEVIYRGPATSYIDRIPAGVSEVSYSIYSESGYTASSEYTGETVELESSNVFIGINGVPTPVLAVYVGKNGVPVPAGNTVFVGN